MQMHPKIIIKNVGDLQSFVSVSDFARICQQSGTEFHFPDLDKQLCLIQQMFEKRDRSKSSASEHQQLPSADVALRPLTLNTGWFLSWPLSQSIFFSLHSSKNNPGSE